MVYGIEDEAKDTFEQGLIPTKSDDPGTTVTSTQGQLGASPH